MAMFLTSDKDTCLCKEINVLVTTDSSDMNKWFPLWGEQRWQSRSQGEGGALHREMGMSQFHAAHEENTGSCSTLTGKQGESAAKDVLDPR